MIQHPYVLAKLLFALMCCCLVALFPLQDSVQQGTSRSLMEVTNMHLRSTRRTLVVYTGPIHLPIPNSDQYDEQYQLEKLYIANFDYFLHHGGFDCSSDVVLVVGPEVATAYQPTVQQLNQQCVWHSIKLVARETEECGDMESMRLVLPNAIKNYEYFIHVSCEMTGPAPSFKDWTSAFIQRLSDSIKLVGISLQCDGTNSHIHNKVFAMDNVGMLFMKELVTDCRQETQTQQFGEARYDTLSLVAGRYDIALSQAILQAEYKIYSILGSTQILDKVGQETCQQKYDMWVTSRLKDMYGAIPKLDQVIFFQTTRYLPPDIKKLIGYVGVADWEWK